MIAMKCRYVAFTFVVGIIVGLLYAARHEFPYAWRFGKVSQREPQAAVQNEGVKEPALSLCPAANATEMHLPTDIRGTAAGVSGHARWIYRICIWSRHDEEIGR